MNKRKKQALKRLWLDACEVVTGAIIICALFVGACYTIALLNEYAQKHFWLVAFLFITCIFLSMREFLKK